MNSADANTTTGMNAAATGMDSAAMNQTNQHGQGASHATGDSKVPAGIQRAAPQGLEEKLPDSVHPTGGATGQSSNAQSTNQSHAVDPEHGSIVPKKLQEKLPEKIERAVPNAIHDTGDTDGLHRSK